MTATPMPVPTYTQSQLDQIAIIEANYAPPVQLKRLLLGDSRMAPVFFPEAKWSALGEDVGNAGVGGFRTEHVNDRIQKTGMDLSAVEIVDVMIGVNNLESGGAYPNDAASWVRTTCVTIARKCPALTEPPRVLAGPPWIYLAAYKLRDLTARQDEYFARLGVLSDATGKFSLVPCAVNAWECFDPARFIDGVHPQPETYDAIAASLAAV